MIYPQDQVAKKGVKSGKAVVGDQIVSQNKERGITLQLAILVLAAVSAIVFSVAAITANEIRTSNDLTRTEPAITVAEAGAEDVLYYQIRGLGGYSTNCSAPSTATLSGVSLSYCSNPYLSNPYNFAFSGPSGEKDFYLYNPSSSGGAPGYTNISITLNSGISGTANICSWQATNCATTADVASLTFTTGQTKSQALDPNATTGYQIIFLNTNASSDAFSVTTTPTGMPSGTATIQTTGSNNGVTRKLQTILPQ